MRLAPLAAIAFASILFSGGPPAGKPIRGFPDSALKQRHELEARARAIPQPDRIRDYIRRISAEPHHAGSPGSKAVAEDLAGLMRGWGLDARIEEFEALLPTPKSRVVELVEPARFRARLAEPVIPEDPDSGDAGQLPSYNAYSAAGDVTAPLVYVNYGVPEDYEYLKRLKIDVKGKIVIARYGGSWRGVKPKVAYENGAVGCLIYSDPRDDGYFAGDVYPKGPFRPQDGIQRGSVMDMAVYPGDPLSPGFASEKGGKRLALQDAVTLQKIPVMPISHADALVLLRALDGPVAPEAWRGALPVTYHLGPGAARVRLALDFDWSTRPLYNVIARIPGAETPDQWVLYGNHHDAWVNGAADPASGAAALLETARTLAELVKTGWKPKRTVIFTVWDGEEFGLVGSTEWAEKHAAELREKAVVYLNSDMNGGGSFGAGGAHSLEKFTGEVLRDIPSPGGAGKSLLHVAEEAAKDRKFRLGALGSGSDYTVFLQHLGIASINAGFDDAGSKEIYHSIYDSFAWYSRFSDTDFSRGRALAQFMVTALLRLADAGVLPFEFGALQATVAQYADEVSKLAAEREGSVSLKELRGELERLRKNAAQFEAKFRKAEQRGTGGANALLPRTERVLAPEGGLPDRPWFTHLLYAPGMYTGYAAKTLPGIREAIEAGKWELAAQQSARAAAAMRELNGVIKAAARALDGP
jgi:N-acetylated-alpha-linked acidic dipeptidase